MSQVTCAHSPCNCPVEGDLFCSDHCMEHGEHDTGGGEHACECGHPECRAA